MTRAPLDEPRLVVLSGGPLGGRTYAVHAGTQLLGRGPDAQVVLDSAELSRRHAWLRWDGATASIADAGSRNGTTVNGEQVAGTHALRNGDIVRLGRLELRFESSPEADDGATASYPAIGARLDMSGVVHGDAQQALRDINNQSWNDIRLDAPDPMDELFQGRGTGRLLMALGLLVALAGFGGWMYMIFRGGANIDSPGFDPFAAEVAGLPAAMVAFGAFAIGGLVSSIGAGMSRAARERRRDLQRQRSRTARGPR